jgi:hypothetical protein
VVPCIHRAFDEGRLALIPHPAIVYNLLKKHLKFDPDRPKRSIIRVRHTGCCVDFFALILSVYQLYAAYRRNYDGLYCFPYFLIACSETYSRGLVPRYREPRVKLLSEPVDEESTVPDDGGSSPDFDTHRFPFNAVGPLLSHVFPHFAICNAAQKFTKSPGALRNFLRSAIAVLKEHAGLDAVAAENLLREICRLYGSWTSVTPDRATTAPDENPSDDEQDEEWNEPDYVGVGEPLPVPTETSVGAETTKKSGKAAAKFKSTRAGAASQTSSSTPGEHTTPPTW